MDNSRQLTATFACIISDDCGESWSESYDIPLAKTKYDKQDNIQDNIVFQLPMRAPDGSYLSGFTKYISKAAGPEFCWITRVYFFRFDNIDKDPDIKDLKITVLPENDDEGISVCHPPGKWGRIEEPAWVNLPDGRIFCSMRTDLGFICHSISNDCGRS